MKRRFERLRSNPWIVVHALGTVVIYSLTIFLTATLLGSQSTGVLRVVFTLVGAGFEFVNLSIMVEAVKRKKFILWVLCAAFMFVSFCGAALGMMTSFKNSEELRASSPLELRRAALMKEISETELSLKIEQDRLAAGSVQYRTDAENTRASAERLQVELSGLRASLSALPPPERSEASGGYFAAVPFKSERSRFIAELVFRIFISALMQIGGCASTVFVVEALDAKKSVQKGSVRTICSKDGFIHFGIKTERDGIYRTDCGRLTRPVRHTQEHHLCPDCMKLSMEVSGESANVAV